jgi:hypothetical protein
MSKRMPEGKQEKLEASESKKPYTEPKLTFIEPKLTKYGDTTKLTQDSFFGSSITPPPPKK